VDHGTQPSAGPVEMAVLLEGQKFGLSSKSDTCKSVVYVKLTDSALRSLEDYLKHRAVERSGPGPTIQFSESGGAICLPSSAGQVTYSFGLSSEDGGPNKQGSTGCLRSTNNTLESVGTVSETLRVKASEDVYKRIGQKFEDVKLENSKKQTVLLDRDNKDKKKASLPKSQIVRKVHSSTLPLPGGSNSGRDRTLPSAIPYNGLGPGRGNNGVGSRPHSPGQRAVPRPLPNSPSQYQTSRPSSQTSQAPDHRSQAKYPQTHKPSSSKPVNTEIMKKTLRERLIHLLAVRPYKKPELIVRMYKDGVKDKDKKNIGLILREVSECKNNVFELKRTMWNDVCEDWPFYSELDKAALRRRKPQNLTPPGSDTGSTSSGHSPSSTNPASPPQITNPLKRHSVFDQPVEQGPTPKKKRVSSYKRPPGSNSWDSKSPGLTGVSPRLGMVVVDRHQSVSPRLDLDYNSVPDDSIPDWGQFHDGEAHRSPTVRRSPEHHAGHAASSALLHQKPREQSIASPSLEETVRSSSPGESPEQQSHTDSPQMQLCPNKNLDFLSVYTPIVSVEQRVRYKSEFNQYYAKYRALHKVLDTVSKKFAHLEARLKEAQKGSQDFKNVKHRIVEEYEKNKKNQTYQEARSNFQYLHEKLAHIKKLVHDYDTNNLSAAGSTSR